MIAPAEGEPAHPVVLAVGYEGDHVAVVRPLVAVRRVGDLGAGTLARRARVPGQTPQLVEAVALRRDRAPVADQLASVARVLLRRPWRIEVTRGEQALDNPFGREQGRIIEAAHPARGTIRTLLQMSVVLTYGTSMPVVSRSTVMAMLGRRSFLYWRIRASTLSLAPVILRTAASL